MQDCLAVVFHGLWGPRPRLNDHICPLPVVTSSGSTGRAAKELAKLHGYGELIGGLPLGACLITQINSNVRCGRLLLLTAPEMQGQEDIQRFAFDSMSGTATFPAQQKYKIDVAPVR